MEQLSFKEIAFSTVTKRDVGKCVADGSDEYFLWHLQSFAPCHYSYLDPDVCPLH